MRTRVVLLLISLVGAAFGCAGTAAKTPQHDLLAEALENPIDGGTTMRPGWTSVWYPEKYRQGGVGLVRRLIAYLRSHPDKGSPWQDDPSLTKRDARVMLVAELAADLDAKEAIPFLVSEMERTVPDDDTMLGSCLVAKLAELTQIENGYRYHRRWFDPRVQHEAVAAYKEWMRKNGYTELSAQ